MKKYKSSPLNKTTREIGISFLLYSKEEISLECKVFQARVILDSFLSEQPILKCFPIAYICCPVSMMFKLIP